ncbi:dihydroxy-acid dehydratase [uncultured Dysosmobacter sp.]|uniref:dihydroxy-acid dehydratase n=1 Tax=uncultured Dysosmobacter sp. TaxID=2591384 RepID=UPI002627DB6B|nr:dihydroxy-acid dehydratase [uncultured Dysosmobacter sp.]
MAFKPHHSMVRCPENCNHRALFKAVGYSDHDLEKPMIGIANSWNEIVPGHFNLRQVAEFVKRGIYSAGGTAVEFGTIAACDGIAQGDGMFAILPTREVIANSIELMVRAHNLDAIVLLGSCDKIIPGMLMAAARLDIPAIVLPGGPMQGGAVLDNRPSDSTSMSEAVGMMKVGKLREEDLYTYENSCVPTCGSCSFYGTANTMCCTAEAMGIVPSGGAAIPAYHMDRLRMAEHTGERIVQLVKDHITARQILTLDAIENGVIFVNATGGSTNAILHLSALAYELGIPTEKVMDLFEKHGKTVPQVVKINPASAYNMEDLFYSGGVPQVLKELRPILNQTCMTVDGKTIGDLTKDLSNCRTVNRRVIKTIADPFSVGNGLAILRGNLAPDGCVTKPAAIKEEMRTFTGTARVFDSEDSAIEAILGGNIQAGDVLVIRYEGPKGGPGMREMCNAMKYLYGLGLGTSTAIITDGRFSGTNNGCFVGHISPEAAENGPIAAVQENDRITIDIPNRVITLHVEQEEIQERLKTVKRPAPRFTHGYLAMYSKSASSASEGAVLK